MKGTISKVTSLPHRPAEVAEVRINCLRRSLKTFTQVQPFPHIYIFVYGELTQIQLPSVSFQAGVVLLLFQFCFRTETSSLKPVGEKGDTLPLTAHCCFSTAELTAKWIWCGAVPLLSASILPEALHQVWIGVLQRPPPPGPLLQPPHPALRSADEVWPEELQSLLGWGGRGINTVSSLLGRRIHCNSQTLILKKEEKKTRVRICSENILNLFFNLGESSSQPCNSSEV